MDNQADASDRFLTSPEETTNSEKTKDNSVWRKFLHSEADHFNYRISSEF